MNKKNKLIITSTAVALCVTTIASSIAITLSKKNKYDGKTIQTTEIISTTNDNYEDEIEILEDTDIEEIETTKVEKEETTKEEVTKNIETTKVQNKIDNQDDLINERINNLCKKNNYDNYTSKKIKEMFKTILKNYDDFYKTFKSSNFYDKEEFIDKFLTRLENNNTKVHIFNEKNNYNKEYEKVLNDCGATGVFLTDENTIYVNDYDDSGSLAVLFEELIHSTQKKTISNFQTANGEHDLIIEGEPAIYRMLFNDSINKDNYMFLENHNELYQYYGIKNGDVTYYGRYYAILGQLVGFDFLDSFKENYNKDILIDKLETNYDIDARKMVRLMCKDEMSIRDTLEVEKMYCDCMVKKIDNVNSKGECLDVINQYRFYKNQFGIRVNDNNDNFKDITYERIDYGRVEQSILNKVEQYNVFDTNHNKELLNLIINNTDSISIDSIKYKETNDKIYTEENNNVLEYDFSTNTISYSDLNRIDGKKIILSNNVKTM